MNWNSDDDAESWREEFSPAGRGFLPRRKFTGYSKSEFYESVEWKALREQVLSFYGRVCMRCDKYKNVIIQVDHIEPRSRRKDLELRFDNMQVLCKACNDWKGGKTIDYRSRHYHK